MKGSCQKLCKQYLTRVEASTNIPQNRDRPESFFNKSAIMMPQSAQQSTRSATGRKARRWSVAAVEALMAAPFGDLIFRAQKVHRQHFAANQVQLSTLLSIKTGGCPEDCGYCPQAARYHTGVENQALMSVEEVVLAARAA